MCAEGVEIVKYYIICMIATACDSVDCCKLQQIKSLNCIGLCLALQLLAGFDELTVLGQIAMCLRQ